MVKVRATAPRRGLPQSGVGCRHWVDPSGDFQDRPSRLVPVQKCCPAAGAMLSTLGTKSCGLGISSASASEYRCAPSSKEQAFKTKADLSALQLGGKVFPELHKNVYWQWVLTFYESRR